MTVLRSFLAPKRLRVVGSATIRRKSLFRGMHINSGRTCASTMREILSLLDEA